MVQDRCALVLRMVLCLVASTILVMTTNAFAFTAKIQYNQAMMVPLDVDEKAFGLLPRRVGSELYTSATDTDEDGGADASATTSAVGLYKQYADYAVEQLRGTGWLQEDSSVPENLSGNQAPARGAKTESIVRINTKALVPTADSEQSVIRYARITLLETVPLGTTDSTVSPDGIQVLNFVVLPSADTTLPVLGIDLVSLPGSKHLLLLDAQPMAEPNPHEGHWEGWYNEHVRLESDNSNDGDNDDEEEESLKYAWGGDFPEAVKKYVSKYALWTRLQNLPESVDGATSPAVDAIQGDLFVAFQAHVDNYLELLGNFAGEVEAAEGENHQPAYLDYRRNNDPAKPMLNSLYGAEWTQSLLDNVLFPRD